MTTEEGVSSTDPCCPRKWHQAQDSTHPDPKLAAALEEYKVPAVRSEASKESLEDQMQKVAATKTETQQAQQTASWVESEAVQDAANVEQAVKGARRCRERSSRRLAAVREGQADEVRYRADAVV